MYVRVYMYVCLCLCTFVCVCVCVYMCVCVWIFLCVCMFSYRIRIRDLIRNSAKSRIRIRKKSFRIHNVADPDPGSSDFLSPVPEFMDQVFGKTSSNSSFSVMQNERIGLVFPKSGSINSGTGSGIQDGKKSGFS